MNIKLYPISYLFFKALSIAQRFILLLPVHGITAPCEQKSTLFKLVWESVSGVYAHSCMGYCESNVQVIVNLMCRTCVYHCRGCYAVIRKYSAYTEAKMQKNQIDSLQENVKNTFFILLGSDTFNFYTGSSILRIKILYNNDITWQMGIIKQQNQHRISTC